MPINSSHRIKFKKKEFRRSKDILRLFLEKSQIYQKAALFYKREQVVVAKMFVEVYWRVVDYIL